MMNYFKNKFKKIPSYIWILLVIILVGIFLRTYNFHDWLRFNPDQARDAGIVSGVIQKTDGIPLLGPKAGGTDFKLGPVFYYFQYASARIFGDYPDSMAYPDLASSILMMPLLFFFLRRYFSINIALALTALNAVSLFSVRFGRFAWNPNSMPFWTLLLIFSMLFIFDKKTNKKYPWAILAGIALGVAVQLHTLLLVILPIWMLIILGYALYKKLGVKKYFAIILFLTLMLNIPQIIDGFQAGGGNIQAFFAAQKSKGERNNSMLEAIGQVTSCTFQANIHIVSGISSKDDCSFFETAKDDLLKRIMSLAGIALGLILTIGSILIYGKAIFAEKDTDRKNFLLFSGIFFLLYFLILMPVARDVSMRFYLGMAFIPFVLLGMWLDYLSAIFKKRFVLVAIAIIIGFASINLRDVNKYFASFSSTKKEDLRIITLSEAEGLAGYIAGHTDGKQKIIIDGKNTIMFRLFRPVKYILSRNGISIKQGSAKDAAKSNAKLFIIAVDKGESLDSGARFGRFIISEGSNN